MERVKKKNGKSHYGQSADVICLARSRLLLKEAKINGARYEALEVIPDVKICYEVNRAVTKPV